MRLPLFQVDAFSRRIFGGNPAAVVPLEEWLPDATLQLVAAENNLSETAFLVHRATAGSERVEHAGGAGWDLRWFTPTMEVDLCGHATLASARIVLDHLAPGASEVHFHTRSGELVVTPVDRELRMDFPAYPPMSCETPPGLTRGLGGAPREVLRSPMMFLAVYDSEAEVRALVPHREALMELDLLGVIASAHGEAEDVDFVSRFFAPKAGVLEDPVTGSAHCVTTPYWSRRLGRSRLRARQISARGGELTCEDRGERVWISGEAVTYLVGEITLP